jgi:DNA mismatch endonuclease (patch repair protein)
MDRLTKQRRSEIMSRIRGKDTVPELKVRSLIHKLGYRFRLHSKTLPGKPDLVFSGRKKIIFVHGCFWHGHEGCPKGKLPKSKLDYWEPKLSENKRRDMKALRELKAEGWKALVVWQCELKDIEKLKSRIIEFLA